MKRVVVLYSDYSPIIDAIKYRLNNFAEVICSIEEPEFIKPNDLVVLCGYKKIYSGKALNIKYSLLPAFTDSNDPIMDAFLAGVKVTGITFCYTNPSKILAQYPIFIKNEMHYDELVQELKYTAQVLYPLIIECLVKDSVIDLQKIVNKSSCSGSCGGCTGCNH